MVASMVVEDKGLLTIAGGVEAVAWVALEATIAA